MDIKILDQTFDTALWNHVANHPMQTWEWGKARHQLGIQVVRLGQFNGKQLTHSYQMTVHKLPGLPYYLGYIPRSVLPTSELIDFLKKYAQKHGLIFIKFEPYARQDLRSQILDLRKSPTPLFPNWTMWLDLTKSEDELLKQLKSKTRYNMRLAQKKGVTVREESNDLGFEKFIKLYFETTKRQQYHGHNYEYHQTIWRHMKQGMAKILIAYYQDKPLAAYELFHFHDVLYYPYGGSSLEHKNVMAPSLLMWEAIKLGKCLGAKTFDLWGSMAPNYDQSSSWAGFTRFKEGYGAEFVEMVGSWDLVIDPIMYTAYNVVYKIRNRLLGGSS